MPLIIIINIIIQRNQQKNSNYRVLLKINDIKRMRIEKPECSRSTVANPRHACHYLPAVTILAQSKNFFLHSDERVGQGYIMDYHLEQRSATF
jgi:hypothetical protein